MGQLGGIEEVVFDGVAGRQELGALEAGDGMDHVQLHLERQTVRSAVGIDFRHSPALRLDEDVVVGMRRELDHLVLDGRTVADAGTFDEAAVQGRIRQVRLDDLDRPGIRMGQPARDLVGARDPGRERRQRDCSTWNIRRLAGRRTGPGPGLFHVEHPGGGPAAPAEKRRRLFAGLDQHLIVVDAVLVQPRRRAGLEAFHPEAQILQLEAQAVFGRLVEASAADDGLADVDFAAQEGSGGQHDGFGGQKARFLAKNARNPVVFDLHGLDLVGDEGQVVLGLQDGVHAGGIGRLVALDPVSADGGAFAAIEHPELDSGAVGVQRHLAAEGVEFEDHVRFGDAADGRIAGHPRRGQRIHRDQGRADAQPRRGQRRLAAGMSGADHHDVVGVHREGGGG